MGCGSSNQTHDVNSPMQIEAKGAKSQKRQQHNTFAQSKCYLFGQSSGERKVVCFNASKQYFTTLSSRIRIPIPKIKLEPIEILYQQSQQIILPDLMKREPSPPFNFMFGAFCRKDVIFLCGGLSYQGDHVYSQAYFYNLNPHQPKPKSSMTNSSVIPVTKTYVKFEQTAGMANKRYSHMGVYYSDPQTRKQYVYVFGGKNGQHQPLETCQRFDITTKKWRDIAPMFSSRAEGCSILFLNNIYVFGGVSQFRQYPQHIEVYSIKSDTWSMLNIRLHRGIRSCLILSDRPNELLIFGGITLVEQQEIRLNSVIRVNLIQETYAWETNLPERISNVKFVYERQEDRLSVFSNQNNLIYQYLLDKRLWKSLATGYKNYVPVIDLKGFVCVTEGLQLNFDIQDPIKADPSFLTDKNPKPANIFILGNENYPCLLTLTPTKHPNLLQLSLTQISMKLHLKSHMSIAITQKGYFICGGCDTSHKHSQNQAYFYETMEANCVGAVEALPSMRENRNSAGIGYDGLFVYVFGGKNKKAILRSCQKYNIKARTWQANCKPMIKSLYSSKTHVLDYQPNKILVYGGKEDSTNNPTTLLQIYDGITNDVIAYSQFPALGEFGTSTIFVEKPTQEEIKKLDLQKAEQMLEIAQFYSNRSSLQRQQLQQQYSSNQSMKKTDKITIHPTQPLNLKTLAAQHIPTPILKPDPIRYESSQVEKQGAIEQQRQNPKITEIKTTAIYVQPSQGKKGDIGGEGKISDKLEQGQQKQKEKQEDNQKQKDKQKQKEIPMKMQKLPILESQQDQNVQFIPLLDTINKKQSNPNPSTEEQPSSQSLLTKQKNQTEEQPTSGPTDKDYEVLKIYTYHNGDQQMKKVPTHSSSTARSIYYLLIDRNTHKMQLLRNPQTQNPVKLAQPLHYTHTFRMHKQQNRHYFINLSDLGTKTSSQMYIVDTESSDVEKYEIMMGEIGKAGAEVSGFSLSQYFT